MNEQSLSLITDLQYAIIEEDEEEIHSILSESPKNDIIHDIMLLDEKMRDQLFRLVDLEEAADILRILHHLHASDVIAHLSPVKGARILEQLDSHQQAMILRDLDSDDFNKIIQQMARDGFKNLHEVREYPENSAGSLMSTETLTFRRKDTVGEALTKLVMVKKTRGSQFKFYPYVVDRHGYLVGVVSALSLIGERSDRTIMELVSDATSIHVDHSLEKLHWMFEDTDYFSFPVVDEEGKLIGVVYREDVAEQMLDVSESDGLKAQGVIHEELRTMPLILRSRRRLAWLSANIVLNIIAASVISAYEQTLAAVIAIAVFLPMVSDMSGCSGNQAVAVSMRELALGLARPTDTFRIWLKEVSVGLINGTILGILIGAVAWLWKGNPYLGVVIGTALALNTVIAVSIGGTVPLILKKFNIDPAVASGPLLTTITDMAGFFLVLSLAQLMMPLLLTT
ncbi:MAG: magnesium transporter [Magnetococcales bacterium]|nr:magnesium transporter [Magnetococcales bacterium]